MASVKRGGFALPRWALLMYVCVMSLLLLGYSVNQYWQYRHYTLLDEQLAPIDLGLKDFQRQIIINTDKGRQLHEEVAQLSQSITDFIQFTQRGQAPLAGVDDVLNTLQSYQSSLQSLQDADLHSRFILDTFTDRVLNSLPHDSSDYPTLLRRCRQYLNAPNMQYLYTLDDEARRWQEQVSHRDQEMVRYYQLYRKSLTPLVQLRHSLVTDNMQALLQYRTRWQQQSHQHLQGMQIALLVWLILCFSLGIIILALHNRELRNASQAALALAKAKTDFLANMSHEIRTPMNAIIGFASLLQQTPLTVIQQQHLKKISQSSDNLLLLINDILDLTKVEAGKLELENIAFDLNEQLEKLSGLFADLSEHKQLEVIIDKSPNVPNWLMGDPLRLGQVLTNLVSNAVKFTERGEVVLSIRLCHDPELRLCFTVKDTGIGILPEQLDRLFHAFTQVDASTTRKYGGTGLGLSISYHLVQLMAGNISVDSQLGRGSNFMVSLPLQLGVDKPTATNTAYGGKTVLLVDDNAHALNVSGQLLQQLGLTVYRAQSLAAGKELLQKHSSEFDLALIDSNLGEDDGIDLARFIMQQTHLQHIEMIILSAFAQDRIIDKMRPLGLKHYLAKPITELSLCQSLTRVCAGDLDNRSSSLSSRSLALTEAREQLQGLHLLLVEDNRMNQQLIIEFLRQVKVSVSVADNGRQALEMFSKQPFDGILMDLQMPILDGIETTRQIRKLNTNHDIPIIALTASAMRGDREISLAAGMNHYVTKPVDRFALYQALVQVLMQPTHQAHYSPATIASHHRAYDARPTPAVLPVAISHSTDEQLNDKIIIEDTRSPVPSSEVVKLFEHYQDITWQIMAMSSAGQWGGVQTLLQELIVRAEALALLQLVDEAQSILKTVQQQQTPTDEQLKSLKHQLH